MAQRGAHKISGAAGSGPEPTDPGGSPLGAVIGCLGAMASIVAVIVVSVFVLAVITPSGPSAPVEPPPPGPKIARFTPADPASDFTVDLMGQAYEFAYTTVDALGDLRIEDFPADVFVADFNTRTKKGSEKSADTLVLIGDIQIQTTGIAARDVEHVSILSEGEVVRTAIFNRSAPPTGPPGSAPDIVRKRIFIVGTLSELNMGDSRGESRRDIRILELDPTAEDLAAHQERLGEYRREQQKYETTQKVEAAKAGRGGKR